MSIFEQKLGIKKIFFFLTLLAGLIILAPFSNFQPSLSQGDHGSNLYAFQRTFYGEMPYRDYWYPYGPFMPFYYSFFFRIFGENIQSVLVGLNLLKFLSGIFCYSAISCLTFPFLGFLTAVWFWAFNPDFFFNFNHSAAICAQMAVVTCLFHLIVQPKKRYFFLGGFCCLLILFIRINIGVSTLIAFLISLAWLKRSQYTKPFQCHRSFYIVLSLSCLATLLIILSFVLQGFPSYSPFTYLPFLKRFFSTQNFLTCFKIYAQGILEANTSSMYNLLFALFSLLIMVRTYTFFIKEPVDSFFKIKGLSGLGVTFLLFILSSHEFFASAIDYRIAWMIPFEILFLFLCIGFGIKNLKPSVISLICLAIFFIPISRISQKHSAIAFLKKPQHYLSLKKGHIFTGNSAQWTETVEETTYYLTTHLKKDELFFAIPYDPIYYYLTGKKNPFWTPFLIGAHSFSGQEEQKIIEALQKNHINYIILSNRMYGQQEGLGILGKTYLKNLYSYIQENYEETGSFGDWDSPAEWVANHATKILKRKK